MKIHVNRIPEDGLDLDAAYDPAALKMDQPGVHVAGPVRLHGRATLEAKELFVSAEVEYELSLACARCLAAVASQATTSLVFHYDMTARLVVDITSDVRQEVMLAYPLTALCRPDCRGLCAVCGTNWNDGPCPHRT